MRDTSKNEKEKISMRNITINIPDLYDKKIQWLIERKLIPSRSEAIRTALREFLHNEYNNNLDLLGFFEEEK
jgi:Arc/MetJ-type ribon-helix-helix transcriptional regulator